MVLAHLSLDDIEEIDFFSAYELHSDLAPHAVVTGFALVEKKYRYFLLLTWLFDTLIRCSIAISISRTLSTSTTAIAHRNHR